MTKVRNTQSAAEVVIQADPEARNTQSIAEVLVTSTPEARNTQSVAEALVTSTPYVQNTQTIVEVLFNIVTLATGTVTVTENADTAAAVGEVELGNKALITEQPDTTGGLGLTISTLVQPDKKAQIDVKLVQNSPFDFLVADDGDFVMVDGFDTSIQMSIFCERRASESEVSEAIRRRGWIGNVLSDFPGFEIGSKIWLFEQARMTNDTFNGVRDAAVDSLEWMVEDGFATDITSSIAGFTKTGEVKLQVNIFASTSLVEQRFFTLWTETGVS